MRVPDDAGEGPAKLTLSFPGWKAGRFEALKFEVPVVEAWKTMN